MKYATIDSSLFIQNRANFMKKLAANSIAIFHSNFQYTSSADLYFKYKQDPNFFYLTGIDQEESILFLYPDCPNSDFREVLFVRETNPHIQVWEGHKLSLQEATELSGIKVVRYTNAFEDFFSTWMNFSEHLYLDLNEHDRAKEFSQSQSRKFALECKEKFPLHSFKRSFSILAQQRAIKSKIEIDLIQKACNITGKTFERVLKFVKPGVYEYEIEAEITHEFIRNRANGHAYSPIVASGINNNILHYVENNQICKSGDLILFDFGCEYANYASDLSRTIPVNGKFTERQKQVYLAVLETMKYATSLLKPGTLLADYNANVGEFVEEQLVKIGLLSIDAIKHQDLNQPLYKKYFVHNPSHFMGLDVHDVGNRYLPMEDGMVFTCEPGIYIPEEGFGIRLENDILVTKTTPIDLMSHIPIELADIEYLMNT